MKFYYLKVSLFIDASSAKKLTHDRFTSNFDFHNIAAILPATNYLRSNRFFSITSKTGRSTKVEPLSLFLAFLSSASSNIT